ncbi:MAG: homing endonuclease associated repeat-containing protein [Terriglobales bacterium]
MLTRKQILSALRAAARQLGRAPTRAELLHLTGIHYGRLIPHFPGGYRSAIRAAGLSPDPGGLRIGTADLLADWARLARKKGRVPTRDEYEHEGRYASASLETRFHRWTQVPSAFLKFAESMGLSEQWSDVVGIIHNGPMPKRGGGRRWLKGWKRNHGKKNDEQRNAWKSDSHRKTGLQKQGSQKQDSQKPNSSVPAVAPQAGVSVLPPPLHGMKCVTVSMLAILFSVSSLRTLVPRSVYPDRPLLGAPMDLPGFLFEPTNEMGVVLLFGMLFWRLGFIIESAQIGYPDCRAKLEVEPGRWQDVGIEFELHSRHFLAHRHDPSRADFIVCWIHNWKGCPPHLRVIELREVVRRLSQLPHSQRLSF